MTEKEQIQALQDEIARLEAFYNAMKPLVINLDTGDVKNIYFGYEDGKVYITPISVQGIIAAYKQVKELPEAPKPHITDFANEAVEMLTGVPTKPKQFVTKNNETMATFQIGNAVLVAFPKTWQGYKHAIVKAGHEGNALSFHISPIEKDGGIQYMVRAIEGVAWERLEVEDETE